MECSQRPPGLPHIDKGQTCASNQEKIYRKRVPDLGGAKLQPIVKRLDYFTTYYLQLAEQFQFTLK